MPFLLWHYLRNSAEKFPERPAVSWRDTVLTYGELDAESNRLAGVLADSGIGRGTRVGIYMPKSARSVVSMLGALKAGSAYVPLDPNAPPRRVAFILKNCGARGLITTSRKLAGLKDFLPELEGLTFILLADGPAVAPAATSVRAGVHHWNELGGVDASEFVPAAAVETDPAYLLYTSGSTGTPKGVILSHRNALTFVDWAAQTFAVRPEDRLANNAPLHFDLSVFDIYAALRSGACVTLVPDEVSPFPKELSRWIDEQGITVWYSVPSVLIRLLLHGKMERFECGRLRLVLFAGEVFPVKFLREVMQKWPGADFFNLYGPTETNVCTYFKVPRPLDPDARDLSIGRACANAEVFALDDQGRAVGPGEAGELVVRGPSVMLGYWGLPEKTRQVLIPSPFHEAFHDPVYHTGDIVRLEGDGNFTFIGRRDHMIKSRGHRIELGEIEEMLYQHEMVREAVVVATPDEEIGARLNAYVVQNTDGSLTVQDLQTFCNSRLPKYMIPEAFILLSELPKTSTGKIDRVKLAEGSSSMPYERWIP